VIRWKGIVNVVVVVTLAHSAFALNNRSAVSASGLDTNPCTVSSPCRSFTSALAQTAYQGEVIALDSAGYGSFIVSQDVIVSGAPGIHAGITASTGNVITVTNGFNVTLNNLFIMGNSSGAYGIQNTGATLHVLNCYFTNVSNGAAIGTTGTTGVTPATYVDHCTFIHNVYSAIFADGSGAVDHCTVHDGDVRIMATDSTCTTHVSVSDSTFEDSDIGLSSSAGTVPRLVVVRCFLPETSTLFVTASAGSAVVSLSDSYFQSVSASGSYTMYSFGNNAINSLSATLTKLTLQ